MPTYSIAAPDGNTYSIDGPEGATQNDVIRAVLAQYPSAGTAPASRIPNFSQMTTAELEASGRKLNDAPPKPNGIGEDSIVLLIITALIGFGIAYYFERKLTKIVHTKTQRVLLMIAGAIFGLGLMGILNEFFIFPYGGLSTNSQKVASYITSITIIPALFGLVIWILQVKGQSKHTVLQTHSTIDANIATKTDGENNQIEPTEDMYALALNELEGGERSNGLWAKCFAEALGDEQVAKAQYIRHRVIQIQEAKQ